MFTANGFNVDLTPTSIRQHFIGREPESAQATLEDPLALGQVLKQTLCLGACLVVLDSVTLCAQVQEAMPHGKDWTGCLLHTSCIR